MCPRRFHKPRLRIITTAFSKQLNGDPSVHFVAGVQMLPAEWWATHGLIIWGPRVAVCGKQMTWESPGGMSQMVILRPVPSVLWLLPKAIRMSFMWVWESTRYE